MAIRFDTAEPMSGIDDLEPLREIVGDARIVALGEATHGTSEFFKMKHRLTEFLVTEMGFTIFAIEAPWPATKVINDYVLGGDATRSELLDGLSFGVWQTQEVLDLIEWMRDYNMRPGVKPVRFQAFDMQVSGDDRAVNLVLEYLEEVDPAAVERFEEHYRAVPIGGAERALDDLLEHREEYSRVPSTELYEDVVQTARVVVQASQLDELMNDPTSGRQTEGYELRDRFMAENVRWLLDRAESSAKIVLWAHNAHVAASQFSTPGGTTVIGMGSHLRERYSDQMLVVGFDLFSGTISAAGGSVEIPPPSPEDAEHTFAQLGLPRFMMDLRNGETGTTAGEWLLEKRPIWSVGGITSAMTIEHLHIIASLPDLFDVLIYFHATTVSQRLF